MELDVLTIVASVLPFILRSSPVPQHDSALTGDMYYKEVMRSPNVNRFLNVARMDKDTFVKLKHFLWLRGNIRRSISVTVGQKVLIFIHSAPPYGKVKKSAYDDRRRSEFLKPPVSVQILPRIDLPRTRILLSAILPEKVNDYLQVNISLPQISMAHAKTTAFAKTTAHTPTSKTATANATSEKPARATRQKTKRDRPAAPTSPTP